MSISAVRQYQISPKLYNRKFTPSYSEKLQCGVETTNAYNVSEKGNSCTDGKDDGKVGIFSALGNIFQGAAKTLVNGVKGMFTDKEGNFSILNTLKTAGIVAGCLVCPAAGFVLGGVGLATGAVKLGSGVVKALNSTTDAEAKDMWEQVGEGGLTVAASAMGMKASFGAMKAAAGGQSALAGLKPNSTFLEKLTAFGKDTVTSTKNNFLNAKNTVIDFFKTGRDLKTANAELDKAIEANAKQGETFSGSEISKEMKAYDTAKASYDSNPIRKVATDVKDVTFHPLKAFNKLRKSLKSESAVETVSNNAPKTIKAKFGSLTKSVKSAPSNLSKTFKNIWTKLNDGNTTYAQIVKEYGYSNVAEVLKMMTNSGVLDTQI